MRRFLYLVAIFLIYPRLAQASSDVEVQPNSPPTVDAVKAAWGFSSRLTPYEFWLTLVVVIFGILNIAIVLFLFRNSVVLHGERMLRYLIVITVIIAALVLVTAGYSNEQIAPAFALFGTIIGYLLGKLAQSSDPNVKPSNEGQIAEKASDLLSQEAAAK